MMFVNGFRHIVRALSSPCHGRCYNSLRCVGSMSTRAVGTRTEYKCPPVAAYDNIIYSLPSLLTHHCLVNLPSAYVDEAKVDPVSRHILGHDKQLPAGYDTTGAELSAPRWMRVGINNSPFGILKIRQRKMKKHKKKKLAKKNFYLYKAQREKKEKRNEIRLQEHLYGILTKGYEFDAEEYVNLQLAMYRTERRRQSFPPLESFHVVPDNVVYPWPNPFNKRDPLNQEALDNKMAKVVKTKDEKKWRLNKRSLLKWK